jgi:RND family efflux transporter MFP subunit
MLRDPHGAAHEDYPEQGSRPASPHDVPEVLHHRPQRWLKPAGIGAVALAATVVVAGVVTRGVASENLKAVTAQESIPTVSLVAPTAAADGEQLTLPADIEANDVAVLHAQVSGYVKAWRVDIGARVTKGQVLAEIETPELDQQLAQARATLASAQADQQFAKVSAARWTHLLAKDAVSKQEADEKTSDLAAKTAALDAARANVDRLTALVGFKRIVSPFDGVVTQRNAHVGMLVTANAANDPGLFTVADDHRLRIYVHVPQNYSAAIRPGMTAALTVPQFPGRVFSATLTSTSNAVGAQSGAVTVELQTDNAAHLLQPGDYAQASFHAAPVSASTVRLPASAVMFRHNGMAVGVVDANGRAHIRPVSIRRDLGTSVEIATGLSPSDRVINNPPDSLEDGEKVRIATARG